MGYLYKYGQYFCYLMIGFLFLFIIASGNKKNNATITNINNIKSVPVTNLSMAYNTNKNNSSEIPVYNTFDEAITNASSSQVAFYGKLTGYGPDCKGCSGNTACKPSQNVRNGNIYFNDNKYGRIRIVAADKSIPCGSIIRINNISIYSEPVMAVVLDRGGSIKGNHLDLLFETQKNMGGFRTQSDIKFDIIRWGFNE